jgi:phosphatidylserine/phosphatidylglycerophosphate/cardiolipin synthase-like enzyme
MKRWVLAVLLMAGWCFGNSPLLESSGETHRVAIVNSGYDALLLRIHLLRHATHSINVQTFILTNDECGRLFMYELIQAARRGVKVRMIADHFVSDKECGLAAFLATVHPNLEFKYYRPTADRLKPSKVQGALYGLFSFREVNQRMHNKLITVDGRVAVTGGRNIENSYYHFSTGMNFKDRDVLLIGPEVRAMEESFEAFWSCREAVAGRDLTDVRRRIAADDVPDYPTRESFRLNGFFDALLAEADDPALIQSRFADALIPARHVEFIADRPGKNSRWGLNGDGEITDRLRRELSGCERELIMQTPYLVVDASARNFFLRLKKKRPDLRITLSSNSFGSTDNIMAYSANYKRRSIYVEQLGFHIYEYKPLPEDLLRVFPAWPQMKALAERSSDADDAAEQPFLCIHAKSFVMDGHLAYIGTYNLDPRSANLNTEVGLLIDDERVAAQLRADILNDTRPGNSWVIAKRAVPLSLDKVNALLEQVSCASPVDLWPLRNTGSFELIPGKEPVPPDHPEFYWRYRDAGDFPGNESLFSSKAVQTRLLKILNGLATPIL